MVVGSGDRGSLDCLSIYHRFFIRCWGLVGTSKTVRNNCNFEDFVPGLKKDNYGFLKNIPKK